MSMLAKILWFIGGLAVVIIFVAGVSTLVYCLVDKVKGGRGAQT